MRLVQQDIPLKNVKVVAPKEANLFLNGSFFDYSDNLNIDLYNLAADGGALNALKNGVIPDAIIGDKDSFKALSSDIKKKLADISYIDALDQDYTDFEKALHFLQKGGFTKVNVYCFLGDRIDHMLAGLSLVAGIKGIEVILYTATQRVSKLAYKNKLKLIKGMVISLIPYPYAKNVTTKGLQWDLLSSDFALGSFLSISNIVSSEEVSIEYSQGNLYLVR